jgi:hypothetical protein
MAVHALSAAHAPDNSGDEIEIYPNPAKESISIQNGRVHGDVIKIIDRSGRELNTRVLDDGSIDVSTLPSGLYTIMLINNRSKSFKRFIKE